MSPLTTENCESYAMENHNGMLQLDFTEDYARFRYIKRILNRYRNGHDMKERLIINHIQILYNTFTIEATNRMLFLKLPDYHSQLCEILSIMSTLPKTIDGIGHKDETIYTEELEGDETLQKILRERV